MSQKINPASEVVELADAPASAPTTANELVAAISPNEPRFTFWRFTHTHNGEESSPVLFFYTCVAAAGKSIKDRMMYPLMKRAVITGAEQAAGLKVKKRFEVEETSEITEAFVMNELHPQVEVKTAFKRPKRPGR
jgi:twinfilin